MRHVTQQSPNIVRRARVHHRADIARHVPHVFVIERARAPRIHAFVVIGDDEGLAREFAWSYKRHIRHGRVTDGAHV